MTSHVEQGISGALEDSIFEGCSNPRSSSPLSTGDDTKRLTFKAVKD